MKIDVFLNRIREFPKPFFRLVDFEKVFAQNKITVQKSAERLVKMGILRRLMKDVYILSDKPADLALIAHHLYQPSYLSFESVLFKHGVINQPPFGATFATTRRSKKLELENGEFWFSRIRPDLWWGFARRGGGLEADLEKAILDMMYLKSRGKRRFDTDEWDWGSVNRPRLKDYRRRFGKFAKIPLTDSGLW